MLYSRNGGLPSPLPDLIWLSDGSPRTSQEPFTPKEIADAGYVEAPPKPTYDPRAQHSPSWDGTAWLVLDKTPTEIADAIEGHRAAAMRSIVEHINTVTQSALTAYPAAEVESWPIQKGEAETILSAETPTLAMAPFLVGVCQAQFGPADDETRLDQVLEKADAVKANADDWAAMAAYVNGLRARTQLAIIDAQDVAAIDSALAAGVAEVEAFKVANGL